MADIKDKVENVLNEGRILVLGGQVLIGSSYRSIFTDGFDHLPGSSETLVVACLGLMIVGLGLLMFPPAYHQIVNAGQDNERFHRITSNVLRLALVPFAIGLAGDVYVAAAKLINFPAGLAFSGVMLLCAIAFWYLWPAAASRGGSQGRKSMNSKESEERTGLSDRIKEALMEARLILPGAQALLAFQFAAVFLDGFDKLPASSKWIHFACMVSIAISTVFLIAPAAYHRVALRGEDTEHFHQLIGRLLQAALFWLGLGLAGDFLIVIRKMTGSLSLATGLSALLLIFFYGLWFGFTYWRKAHPAQVR